jgi:hypothetical protein
MKNKLLAFRPARDMRCAWLPTGDQKNPLRCVWIETSLKSNETKGTDLCG